MDFDAPSLYPTALWDEKSVHIKTKNGYAFEPHMRKVNLDDFNQQTISQDGNDSAILKIKIYKPPDFIF